jgi:hypothetical protein
MAGSQRALRQAANSVSAAFAGQRGRHQAALDFVCSDNATVTSSGVELAESADPMPFQTEVPPRGKWRLFVVTTSQPDPALLCKATTAADTTMAVVASKYIRAIVAKKPASVT